MDAAYYEDLAGRLYGLLILLEDRLGAEQTRLLYHFVKVGEYGLALEETAGALAWTRRAITDQERSDMLALARRMKMEGDATEGLNPVRAENPVHGSDQQSCPASRPAVMITDHVPAVRLPPDHAASRVAAAVPAQGDMEDRRDLDLAPPARRAATAAAAPPEAELGGPGTAHDPAQRDTQSAPPGATAAGDPGHDPALAPPHRPPPLGRQVRVRQGRPPGHPPEPQGPGSPASLREPRMGLPQDPRRAGRPGSKSSGIDRMGDPEDCRDRPGAAPIRACLVAVPALPGPGDPGVRLVHGRSAQRHPGPCAGRDRARHPAHPHPRSHFASHRGMDHPAGPQPPDGPRRTG